MRIRSLIVVTASSALAVMLAGCATTRDPGWHGRDATPFDTAHAECRAEADAAAEDGREAWFVSCMERHGWTEGTGDGGS